MKVNRYVVYKHTAPNGKGIAERMIYFAYTRT